MAVASAHGTLHLSLTVLPHRLVRLASLFARLPGVGEKTAQRFVMHLLTDEQGLIQSLARELVDIHSVIQPCDICRNWAERDDSGRWLCSVCRDPQRDISLLCVVAKVQDLIALERSHAVKCRYFVLGQLLSPLA